MKSIVKKRLVIYAKDIERLTGKGTRAAQRMMRAMREYFKKGPRGYVTFYEFCEFTQVDESVIAEYLEEWG